jgi:hypothetical protein
MKFAKCVRHKYNILHNYLIAYYNYLDFKIVRKNIIYYIIIYYKYG